MAEIKQFEYSMPELTEALIKYQGLTEGKWMLAVKFGINAINVGPNEEHLSPAAVIPIVNVGLIKSEKENNLTVDAAEIVKKTTTRT